MAAGLGFKTFVSGEVLTAADTNGYLMQGILVFASASARNAAITSPQEGQYCYLKDTNSTEYYDGAAWVSGVEGDISGVTAGTGISGGGTSGTVTVTNSMATTIDAKGDLIGGTGADAFARLAVGTNGYGLVADSTALTGLAWKQEGLTLIIRSAFSASSTVTVDSVFSSTYDTYCIIVEDCCAASSSGTDLFFQFRFGSTTRSSGYYGSCGVLPRGSSTWTNTGSVNAANLAIGIDIGISGGLTCSTLFVNQVGQSSQRGSIRGQTFNGANFDPAVIAGGCDTVETFTGFVLSAVENITGTVAVYGVSK